MANFQVNSIPSWVQYIATNAQTEFSIPFPFINNSDLSIWQNGVLLTLTTDYTLSGANTASGGQLTLNVGASLNDQITIQDLMVIDRTNIYLPVISALTGSALNNDFNRDVIMIRDTTTTINYLMLQYEPYALISQDISNTTDRIIPILGPLQVWRKDQTNSFIEAIDLPLIPIGIEGDFTATNRITTTNLTPGPNYIQQTDFQIVNDTISTQTGNMTITGANDVYITTSGQIFLNPGTNLRIDGIYWPTAPAAPSQILQVNPANSTQFIWTYALTVVAPVQDQHIARFDGTTGSVENSELIIDNNGNLFNSVGNFTLTSVGDLTLAAGSGNALVTQDPTEPLGIATKEYVDNAVLAHFVWQTISGSSQLAANNNGYITLSASQTIFTLPATCVVGFTFQIEGLGAGGWQIQAGGGQYLRFISTLSNNGGTATSNSQYDGCIVVCVTANTEFKIISATTAKINLQ